MARTAEERRAANRIAVAKYRKSHPDQIRQRARARMRRKRQEKQESSDTEKDIFPPKYRSRSSGAESVEGVEDVEDVEGIEGVEGVEGVGGDMSLDVTELISNMKRTIQDLEDFNSRTTQLMSSFEGQSSEPDAPHTLISLARQLLRQKDNLHLIRGTQRRESAPLR
ncbi:hypothetical protein VNI00_007999 [Paramarasmius palmivorus]|uniref:BZIP domain-containing protein n=1 Tax=Paramarasmius palmivorus TaxID=297713 RepID=A0AAW0CXE9_9AGAR